MKSAKASVIGLNYNSAIVRKGDVKAGTPMVNNFFLNQETSALFRYNKMNNTPLCPRHNLNYNMNNYNNSSSNNNKQHIYLNTTKSNIYFIYNIKNHSYSFSSSSFIWLL